MLICPAAIDMKQILVYADSLSWGIVPGTRQRLAFNARWPGVMENTLRMQGVAMRVFKPIPPMEAKMKSPASPRTRGALSPLMAETEGFEPSIQVLAQMLP